MKPGHASGLQIAFLTFALLLLAVPLTTYLSSLHPWDAPVRGLLEKSVPFIAAALAIAIFPALRNAARQELALPIPRDRWGEVAVVAAAQLPLVLAIGGAVAWWYWYSEGPVSLDHRMRTLPSPQIEWAKAFEPAWLVRQWVLEVLLGPILEELVFRGFLYRAWERQWGWLASTVLTSAVFAAYHSTYGSAFLGSVISICVYRRAGSLWAPIIVHATYNAALWYPLLGRHVFLHDVNAPGDLASWGLNLACVAALVVAIPAYLWMARTPHATFSR